MLLLRQMLFSLPLFTRLPLLRRYCHASDYAFAEAAMPLLLSITPPLTLRHYYLPLLMPMPPLRYCLRPLPRRYADTLMPCRAMMPLFATAAAMPSHAFAITPPHYYGHAFFSDFSIITPYCRLRHAADITPGLRYAMLLLPLLMLMLILLLLSFSH